MCVYVLGGLKLHLHRPSHTIEKKNVKNVKDVEGLGGTVPNMLVPNSPQIC